METPSPRASRKSETIEYKYASGPPGRQPETKEHVNQLVKLVQRCGPQSTFIRRQQELSGLDGCELEEEYLAKATETLKFKDLRIDLAPFQVTMSRLMAAICRMKRGRGSPDGCTAEMYSALPDFMLESLARFFTESLVSLQVPSSWTVTDAILIPKVVAAASLDHFRGIARLSAARKLLGYLWLQMLPDLRFESFQTGFVPGSQAADGIFAVKRAAELAREWQMPMYIFQLDLSKAFDRVKHSAIMKTLKLQSCSLQCLAVICALLMQSRTSATLGHVQAPAVSLS